MYSPPLQRLLVQAHIQELHRSRQTRSTRPITTRDGTAPRHRHSVKLSAHVARAIERVVGQPGPEAPTI